MKVGDEPLKVGGPEILHPAATKFREDVKRKELAVAVGGAVANAKLRTLDPLLEELVDRDSVSLNEGLGIELKENFGSPALGLSTRSVDGLVDVDALADRVSPVRDADQPSAYASADYLAARPHRTVRLLWTELVTTWSNSTISTSNNP